MPQGCLRPSRKAPPHPLPLLLRCSPERASPLAGHMARLLRKPHRGGQVVPSSGQQDDRTEVRNAAKFQRGGFCLKLNKGPFLQDTGLGSGICGIYSRTVTAVTSRRFSRKASGRHFTLLPKTRPPHPQLPFCVLSSRLL